MDIMSLKVTRIAHFSLSTHTKQLLLVTFCDPSTRIIKWDGLDDDDGQRMPQGRTDVKVEIVM